MRYLVVSILLLVFCATAVSQPDTDARKTIELLLEDIASSLDEDADMEQIAEDLELALQNPININSATAEDLEKLHFLDEFLIKSILYYIKMNGCFETIYELQLVEGMSQTDIFRLLPFITIEPIKSANSISLKNAVKYGKNQLLTRASFIVEEQDGYKKVSDSVRLANPEKYYPGNAMRLFSRYSYSYNKHLAAGVTAEKDPGEQFFKGHQKKGFDFYSAFVSVHDLGIVKTFVLGDFQAKFGQGLVVWSGMSSGKSSYVMDIRKKGEGVRKYSSADENLFFRGAATTLEVWKLKASLFGSRKKIDASTESVDTALAEIGITSFTTVGIHATPNQIAKEDAITESVYGANVGYNSPNFKVGITGLGYNFSHAVLPKAAPLYKFDFEGKQNWNISVDAQYSFNALYLFGEYARSENGGDALLLGTLMNLAPGLRTSILYRNYSRNYQARYAGGFAEGSKTQNEKGFFFGVEATPIRNWKFSVYYDVYQFPWLRYGVNAPSRGNDFFAQADFALNRNTSMYWKLKIENNQTTGATPTSGIASLDDVKKFTFRYHINYAVGKKWQLKNRIEISGYKLSTNSSEYGSLLYQDVICSPFKYPLSFSMRYALFDTESYNSRLYMYESDVLYAYSIPMVYGRGTKSYFMVTWKPLNKLTIWARVSRLWYADKESIGITPNKIDNNHKTELKFQVRWAF